MIIDFQLAVREGLFARIGLTGPAKSGKSLTALKIMRGLVGEAGRICAIDTERRSLNKHLGKPGVGAPFNAIYPQDFNPQIVIDSIAKAESQEFDGIIIDSLSHFWTGTGGALEIKDNASRRSGENDFTAWRDVTPLHNKMIDAMLNAQMHLIVTMRVKTEYIMEDYIDRNGQTRKKPVKVGLQPIQRAGMEYEFDIVGDLDVQHNMMVSGSRCDELDGKVIHHAGADVAQIVLAWLAGAVATPSSLLPPPPANGRAEANAALKQIMADVGATKEDLAAWTVEKFGKPAASMTTDELRALHVRISAEYPRKPQPAGTPESDTAVNY